MTDKLRRASGGQVVYGELKARILALDLPPGRRLFEPELSQQLQVSRTPLREALRLLLAKPELDVRLRLLVLAVEAMPRLPHKNAALEKLSLLAPPVIARGPVDVEHPVDPPHGTEHVAEVLGVTHLEGKL